MSRRPRVLCIRFCASALAAGVLTLPIMAAAKDIGADPPRCDVCATCPTCLAPQGLERSAAGTWISRTEGNLNERFDIFRVISSFGITLSFAAVYNSYNADGSRVQLDTVMGYGWTHTYNIFLFSQVGSMFRFDGDGRVTRYKLGAGSTYTAAPGYFETLVKNPDGSFTLRQKDGTTYTFRLITGTPFLVVGPVYRLTQIVDRNGNTTTLSYSGGNLLSVTDTYGRSLTFTYTPQKKVSTVTDPAGRVVTFQYDATGRRLTSITDPAGQSVQYTYNVLYQMVSKTDRDGRVFTYAYSATMPTAVNDSHGTAPANLSNPVNWATNATQLAMNQTRVYVAATTSNIDGRGNVWTYQYNTNGYTTLTTAPGGATTQYTYSSTVLQPTTVTDPNGRTTTFVYDARGNQLQVTTPLLQTTTYTYEPVYNRMTSTTDPRGRTTTYTYDAQGNRLQETDPAGQTTKWTYDSHGNVLTDTDKNNRTTTYQYDAFGNRTQITDALGNTTTMTYDAVGNLVSVTDANAHTTTYHYDALNRRTGETDAAGNTTQTYYDGEGNRSQVIDRNGHATSYQYDARLRLTATIDAAGKVERSTYDGNNNRTSATDRNGHTTNYQYDARNRLTQVTDALGHVSTTAYDSASNPISRTDANLHTTTYVYDALNRPITTADAVGNVTQTEYDGGVLGGCPTCGATPGSALVTKQTDANGKVTYFKYDALDRLIRVVRKSGGTADTITPNDAVTSYAYDAQGNKVFETEPNGNAATYAYDAVNRQTSNTNAAGDTTTRQYDGVGNMTQVVTPNGNVINYTYDAVNRQTQAIDSAGLAERYTYDPVGNRLSQSNGNNHTTSYVYDALNRPVMSTDPLGRASAYTYDAVGNPLEETDRNGAITRYTYDAVNRRLTETDALSGVTSYQYDAVGNRTHVTDANSHTTEYRYDSIDRMIQQISADANTLTLTYDGVGNIVTRTDQLGRVTTYIYNDLYHLVSRAYSTSTDTFTYDLSGRMLSALHGGWPLSFVYDGADRVTQSSQNGKVVTYSYDVPGRTRTITYPGGRTIVEQMDNRSRLTEIDDGGATPISQFTYDLGNRVLTRNARNGVTTTYSYNANDWTVVLEHTLGTTRIAGFGYDYDHEGNKKFEERRHEPGRSEAYQYDVLDRLVDYKVGSLVGVTVPVPATQTSYSLDPLGNWNSKTTDATTETRVHGPVNELIKIDTANLAYDANGNTSNDGIFTYTYDDENRLVKVVRNSDAATVGQYRYDALGRRIVKTASAGASVTTTVYFYDDSRIVEEQNELGTTLATYVYGTYVDEVLTRNHAGETYYYHQNALWSVAAVTDSAGSPVERYAYDAYGRPAITTGAGVAVPLNPWGSPHSVIGNPYLFTGREHDEETGLYFYRARYYDAGKGRFLRRDPLGYGDGMNLYAYVADRPTFYVDPSGYAAVETRIRFWHNKVGNPYYLGVAYPVGRADTRQEVECLDAIGNTKGGLAIVNEIRREWQLEYGTDGSFTVDKQPITCEPDILGNSYPGVRVKVEANVNYKKGALWKHVAGRVIPSAASSTATGLVFGFGPQSLAGPILAGGVGFYDWVYDFNDFKASASVTYNVCCQCCADGRKFRPVVSIAGEKAALFAQTNNKQIAVAIRQNLLNGCPEQKQTAYYMLNAMSAASKKALNNKEWDSTVTPGFGPQKIVE